MSKLTSVGIYPLIRIAKRYQLNEGKFFEITLGFLSHRREEILNAQLSKWFSSFDVSLKMELMPVLRDLISELNYSDNPEGYFILNNRFYIKEGKQDESVS